MISEALPRIWNTHPEQVAENLNEIRVLTRGALAEMRALLLELRPGALQETPLPTLLYQLGEALSGRTQIRCQVIVEKDFLLPPQVKIALYRIAQESLNNITKHSRASTIELRLDYSQQEQILRLQVKDDGRGFDLNQVSANRLGLRIMKERAQEIEAQLEVISQPGKGTEITVLWAVP
jgi:signal transduction histidine kinase